MARIAKQTRTGPVATPARRGRPPGSKNVKPAAVDKPTGRVASAKRSVAAAPAPKVSKDELRAQVDKLERGNATLRAKSREAGRAAKAAAARIEELEEQVTRLEKAAVKPKAAAASTPATRAPRGGRTRRQPETADAAPPTEEIGDTPAHDDEEA